MKKIILILVSFVLIMGMFACSPKNDVIENRNTYKITLDLANPQATCEVEYIDVIYGETVSLPTPSLLDHTFVRWVIKGSNETFVDGSVYNFKTNIELKAIWSDGWSIPV